MSLVNSFPGGNGGDFDFENYQPTFTEASTRANIASGEKNSVILGKLKKWYTDLKAVAFSGNASDLTPDSTHRFVTDTEKGTWNGKQNAITAGSNLAFDGNTLNASIASFGIINKSDLYDTTEKVVGKWTDGKPLYQKTVNFGTLPNTTTKSIAHGISNLDSVVNLWGIAKNASNKYQYLNRSSLKSDASDLAIVLNINGANIEITAGQDRSGFSAYVTIQYTKTTDAANSYKYADENDYSTSETIVGKWIDGKPVYQKTVNFGALPNNNTKNVQTGITNPKRIISFEGYSVRTTDGTIFPIPQSPNMADTSVVSGIKIAFSNYGETINITTGQDRSNFNETYITIKYTKTTD